MCLSIVDHQVAQYLLSNKATVWKIVAVTDGIMRSMYGLGVYRYGWNRRVKGNDMIQCRGARMYDTYTVYTKGYHCFLYRADAQKWFTYQGPAVNDYLQLVQCEINTKDIVASGYQTAGHSSLPVVVTRNICIRSLRKLTCRLGKP